MRINLVMIQHILMKDICIVMDLSIILLIILHYSKSLQYGGRSSSGVDVINGGSGYTS